MFRTKAGKTHRRFTLAEFSVIPWLISSYILDISLFGNINFLLGTTIFAFLLFVRCRLLRRRENQRNDCSSNSSRNLYTGGALKPYNKGLNGVFILLNITAWLNSFLRILHGQRKTQRSLKTFRGECFGLIIVNQLLQPTSEGLFWNRESCDEKTEKVIEIKIIWELAAYQREHAKLCWLLFM